MTKQLVTSYSDSNVSKAVKMMVEHNIGSVIVQDEEGPLGVFTERDLLNKILARGKKLEDPILLEIMTRSYDIVSPDATLVDAAKTMIQKKGRLMVFESGNLIGIVTATDIVKEIYKFGKTFDFSKSCSHEVFEEGPKAKLERVIHLMDEKRIGSVIISEGRLPHGIFTERDLLKAVLSPNFKMEARVGDYATGSVITSEEGIDGLQASAIMVGRHIKRLPLIKQGDVTGIVTARDLVEGFANSAW